MAAKIKTRLLILSDTHGAIPQPKSSPAVDTDDEFNESVDLVRVTTGFRHPLPSADVVIHCGDLSTFSTVSEYEATFSMLRTLRAPLKLVIAGNHDLTLDKDFWFNPELNSSKSAAEDASAVEEIIAQARQDGVRYLTEGVYKFSLDNGAALNVYASQYTPVYGGWAFQYSGDHSFDIPPGIDIAMTHGPPYGILDEAGIKRLRGMPINHAGCESLFSAVYRSKPRIHCFGHIHEAWGAYLGTWLDDSGHPVASCPTTEDVLDSSKSRTIQTLRDIRPMSSVDAANRSVQSKRSLALLSKNRGVHIDLDREINGEQQGSQTLFLNAAIQDIRRRPSQLPFVVDMDLFPADT